MAARPTRPEITAQDLMSRLYTIADDSMMGRESGTRGNVMGTDYIAAELRRMGLQPAGDNGTYFQQIPLMERGVAPGASLSVDGAALAYGTDFLLVPTYGGVLLFGKSAEALTTLLKQHVHVQHAELVLEMEEGRIPTGTRPSGTCSRRSSSGIRSARP